MSWKGILKKAGIIATENELDFEKVDLAKLSFAGAEMRTRHAKVALAAVDTAGGVASWQNPHNVAIIITRVIVDVTTVAAATCLLDIGVEEDATTLDDTIIDGMNAETAGVHGNFDDQGTNGQSVARLDAKGGTTDWLTASVVAAGASSGLVGSLYIEYIRA